MKFDPPLLSVMLHTDEPWAIRDNSEDSQYIFANSVFKELCNLPAKFDFEGRTGKEIPHPMMEEYWPEYIKYDRLVEQKQCTLSSMETHVMGKAQRVQSYICDKRPFYDANGHCIGTIFRGKKTMLLSHISIIKGHVLFYPPTELFTDKEWQVIYLLFCQFTNKEMATILHISVRAVENRLTSCLRKAQVTSRYQLVELGRHNGWDRYIPLHFVRTGHILLT